MMKAIIFALTPIEGLWPVSTDAPAVSVPLLGRPLLDWIAQTLRRAGVSELFLALPEGTVPPAGETLPLSVRSFPAGTGSARALLRCAPDLAGEDFLALEEGVLWEPDLARALVSHRSSGLPATVILPTPEKPLQEADRRVLPFPDLPCPQAHMAILSPGIFDCLEDGKDLFRHTLPRLTRAGQAGRLAAGGLCHRLDSAAALVRMTSDLLAGKYGLERPGPLVRPGIWAASPIPEGVELIPPCWIGFGVTLGRGSLIGPHVSLENGVSVGDHSLVQRSVLQQGVRTGNRVTVYGAVVCRESALGNYTVLNEGAAVGNRAVIGDNVILMEGVGVGPGLSVPSSLRLTDSVTVPPVPEETPSEPELSVEDMLLLGRRLGRCGTVGAGGAGFRGLLLARAFGCGAAAQGAAVVFHDGVRPDHAAWLARYYRWPVSVFVDESGGVYFYDQEGRSLTRTPPDGDGGEGSWDLLAGTASAFEAAQIRAAQEGDLPPACTAFHHKKGLNFL